MRNGLPSEYRCSSGTSRRIQVLLLEDLANPRDHLVLAQSRNEDLVIPLVAAEAAQAIDHVRIGVFRANRETDQHTLALERRHEVLEHVP